MSSEQKGQGHGKDGHGHDEPHVHAQLRPAVVYTFSKVHAEEGCREREQHEEEGQERQPCEAFGLGNTSLRFGEHGLIHQQIGRIHALSTQVLRAGEEIVPVQE